jgi:hypothetical protein
MSLYMYFFKICGLQGVTRNIHTRYLLDRSVLGTVGPQNMDRTDPHITNTTQSFGPVLPAKPFNPPDSVFNGLGSPVSVENEISVQR